MNKLKIFFSHEQAISIALSNGEDAVVLALASYKCEEGAHPVRENQPDIAGWVNTQTRHRIYLAQETTGQITFTPRKNFPFSTFNFPFQEERCKGYHDNLVVTPTSSEVRYKR